DLAYFVPSEEAAQPLVPTAQLVPIPSGSGGFNLFPLLGLVGVGILVGNPGGGGDNPTPEVIPAVPEPAGVIAAGLGVAALIGRRRRSR
ncbi:PEP-CTERM sorting domain-containing protein, partial [bacterium]